jgi:hypothetical protein
MAEIITIQKYIRSYNIYNPIIISSQLQTKNWRKNEKWYKDGKSNECEKYQISLIEKIIGMRLNKTDERINMETNELSYNKNPLTKNDGYEWTENFDGKIIIPGKNTYYFNLKFVCDKGGAQTRTLREVYHFIKYQLEYLLVGVILDTYFINILDGDTSYQNMSKFQFLLNKEKYKKIIKYMFVGSLYDFHQAKIL